MTRSLKRVEISLNPYEGLKRIAHYAFRSQPRVEISLNPYEGLKQPASKPRNLLMHSKVEISLNPYEGLKQGIPPGGINSLRLKFHLIPMRD